MINPTSQSIILEFHQLKEQKSELSVSEYASKIRDLISKIDRLLADDALTRSQTNELQELLLSISIG